LTVKLVIVHLDSQNVTEELIDSAVVRRFVGGRGLTSKLLFDWRQTREKSGDEIGPLIIGTGPLTGVPFPMAGRFTATVQSPLTDTIFSSSCGGRLGVYLKRHGIDVLALRGLSKMPCYILVQNGELKINEAEGIWSKPKTEVKRLLRERHGNGCSILLIGMAGENGIPFANIENDGRFLGRGGLGALLGAMRVKAIVVGHRREVISIASDQVSFLAYEFKKLLSASPVTSRGLPQFGTGVLLNYMRELGLLSSRNFQETAPLESSEISGEAVTARLLLRKRACFLCPVACGRVTRYGDGPEYETLWSLGVNLSIFDIEQVAELNALCNAFGLDTISTGSVLGMACELSEKGKLPFRLNYGDASTMKQLIVEIAEKRSRGELLALGAKMLGERVGMPEAAIQVKGLELPAYDPRGAYGQGLGYATSNRGGCHLPGYLISPEALGIPKLIDRFAADGKASLLALNQNVAAFVDSLTLCRFAAFAIPSDYYARIVSAVIGEKITWEESITIGERIWNLERLYNLRHGVAEDALPERFADVPLKGMLKEYYEVRGWDASGVPGPDKLKMLELSTEQDGI
jgi:aldehyde:ferredoxin oxidoreductase